MMVKFYGFIAVVLGLRVWGIPCIHFAAYIWLVSGLHKTWGKWTFFIVKCVRRPYFYLKHEEGFYWAFSEESIFIIPASWLSKLAVGFFFISIIITSHITSYTTYKVTLPTTLLTKLLYYTTKNDTARTTMLCLPCGHLT